MGLFEWYFGLRPLTRFLVAVVPLSIGLASFFFGRRFMPVPLGIGIVMLCCSFPTDGERNKWGDW